MGVSGAGSWNPFPLAQPVSHVLVASILGATKRPSGKPVRNAGYQTKWNSDLKSGGSMSMNTKRISTTILTAILAWVFLCISAAHAEGWRRVGDMPFSVFDFPMVALADGSALAPGGRISAGTARQTQIYDPTSDSWALTGNMTVSREFHAATLLQDGRVLVSGGGGVFSGASAEIFDPASGMWTSTGSMAIVRLRHTLTTLLDGTVLAAEASRYPVHSRTGRNSTIRQQKPGPRSGKRLSLAHFTPRPC